MNRRSIGWAAAVVSPTLLAVFLVPPSAGASDSEVFLDSALAIDRQAGTVTLPLHRGSVDGRTAWYVVTETSSEKGAERRGLNHAPKLRVALGTRAVQHAVRSPGGLQFEGGVNFAPERLVVPGPDGFPPRRFRPGAVGDSAYSPLVTFDGHTVLNATHVANRSGLHDAVVDINFAQRWVELDTFDGFYEGDRIQYLHQEGSVRLVAAIEGSTLHRT